jgi:ATP-dependent DNA helicase RecG
MLPQSVDVLIGDITDPSAVQSAKTTPKTRERLLELIGHNSRVTREALAQQLGISINGVKQHILKLKKEGVLERIGGNRVGSWRIN